MAGKLTLVKASRREGLFHLGDKLRLSEGFAQLPAEKGAKLLIAHCHIRDCSYNWAAQGVGFAHVDVHAPAELVTLGHINEP